MELYKNFCDEKFNADGELTNFSVKYPDNFNFGYDVVDAWAAIEPDKKALVWCNTENEERIFSFRDISLLSNKAANAFKKAGIKKGDKIMVALKRHYEYWYVSIALHKIGAIMIPVTHMLTVNDILHRMHSTDVHGAVCTVQNEVPERFLEAVKRDKLNCTIWTVQKDVPGCRNLTREIEEASDNLERVPTKALDPMVLYFTSGTTGYPKGVVHDYTYPLAHIVTAKYWQMAENNGLHFTVSETGWAKASWGKLYGQWLIGSAVMVYDFDNFEPKQLANIIDHYRVTSFCAPPTVYRYLVRKGVSDFPHLKYAATAGELLNPEVFKKFTENTGLELNEGYGQTETTLLLANFYGKEPLPGSMGKPSPLYNIKLLQKDGSETPVGKIGEIVIVPPESGKQVGLFTQYIEDPELYEQAWRGGVYHTGDAAWKDADGYYWFHGRFDDIIKTGGFRVGPFEVENVLMEHPAILECSVIGIPDELRGQAIKAFIVLSPGYEPTRELEKEIKEFTNSRLAEYKWIRAIEFVDEMPKTISGKIRRTELRKNS